MTQNVAIPHTWISQSLALVDRALSGHSFAHDLANSLTVIQATTEIALEDVPYDSDLGQDIRTIHESVRQANTMVRSFREGLPSLKELTELRDALLRMQAALRLPGDREIDLDFLLPEGEFLVPLSEENIHRMVTNLVTNARHAICEHGEIVIRLRPASIWNRRRARLGPGAFVLLEVEDSGHGMPPEVMRRIFDLGFTTKEGSGGSGQGLSTTRALARSVGGEVLVRSKPGKGTTVSIFLPRLPPEEAQRRQRSADAHPE